MNRPGEAGWQVPAWAALLKIAIHLPVLGRYGFHHDELYFLACGRRLSFGYVDHAPMIPWIARLTEEWLGGSLVALRLPAVLAGAAAVFVTGLLVARLGGGRFAQWIACTAMLVVPVYLRSTTMLTIVAFEPLVWATAALFLVRLADGEDRRLWIAVGAVVGVGLLTKHSTLFLGAAIAAGTLFTPLRRHLLSPWPYLGGAAAFALFLPNLLWQAANDWPTLQFLQRLNAGIAEHVGPLTFTAGQFLYMNPVTAPIWLGGLVASIRARDGASRLPAWLWLVPYVLLAAAGSKLYYLAAAYPVLFAAGAVAIERRRLRAGAAGAKRDWLLPSPVNALLLSAVVLYPVSLPLLPIETTERTIRALTFGVLDKAYEVTGDLHGQFGWQRRVETVAGVYQRLPAAERERTVILTGSYGIAGAIERFGPEHGLPGAVSGHMTYFLWGLPPGPITTVVATGLDEETLAGLFDEVSLAAEVELEDVNPWERTFRVYVGRNPKTDLHEAWPTLRRW